MRTVVIALLVFGVSIPAAAQLKAARPVSIDPIPTTATIGVIGGLSFSEISGDSVAPVDGVRTSFAIGLTGTIPLNRTFSVEPDLIYERKGASGSLVQGGTRNSGTLTLDYAELALLLRAALQPEGDVRPLLFAGPMAAMRVHCGLSDVFAASTSTYNCANGLQKADYGVVIGVGAELPSESHTVSFTARYEIGLRDQQKEVSPYQFRTRAFLLTVAYGLRFP